MLIGIPPFPPSADSAFRIFMDAPVTFAPPQSASLLIELEARQDDLLRQLDELNSRVEQAIAAGQLHVHIDTASAGK